MKKLLSLIGAIGMVTSLSSNTVSCFHHENKLFDITMDGNKMHLTWFVDNSILNVINTIAENNPDTLTDEVLVQYFNASFVYLLAEAANNPNQNTIKLTRSVDGEDTWMDSPNSIDNYVLNYFEEGNNTNDETITLNCTYDTAEVKNNLIFWLNEVNDLIDNVFFKYYTVEDGQYVFQDGESFATFEKAILEKLIADEAITRSIIGNIALSDGTKELVISSVIYLYI
jgi:hypothetical protein